MGSFNSDSEVHRDAKSVLLLAKAKVGVNHQRRESFKFTRACLQSFHEPSQNNGNGLFRDCLETVKSTDSKPSPTKGTKPLPFFLWAQFFGTLPPLNHVIECLASSSQFYSLSSLQFRALWPVSGQPITTLLRLIMQDLSSRVGWNGAERSARHTTRGNTWWSRD